MSRSGGRATIEGEGTQLDGPVIEWATIVRLFTLILSTIFVVSVSLAGDDIDIPQIVHMQMNDEAVLVVPEFSPIGWSNDGKLAWIEVLHIEGRGGDDISYVILDTIENVVEWSFLFVYRFSFKGWTWE